jgi:hypothetical protein
LLSFDLLYIAIPDDMASKDGGQAFAPVLAAVATMQGNVSRAEKTQAHEFLEKFQKSVRIPPLQPKKSG